ncbi:Deoxyribodipyrimidine photo-lyase [Eumeta japonica]|uniref:Deoxyribodipyrimidine photo-lyase n=1 Tax=Eumeta variegata TaxID=151549 RepID=A0A4C1SD96_EUMVA|nr:Deoxyribodipyrimidine photo-lyase [Eumeta japonica]
MSSSAKKRKLTGLLDSNKLDNITKGVDEFIKEFQKKREKCATSIMDYNFNKKRVRVISQEQLIPDRCEGVVYWMSRDSRVQDNWAFLYAQKLALKNEVPLHQRGFCGGRTAVSPVIPSHPLCLFSFVLIIFVSKHLPNNPSMKSGRPVDGEAVSTVENHPIAYRGSRSLTLPASAYRALFLHRSLEKVAAECKSLNISFHLLEGSGAEALPSWVVTHNIGAVVCDFNPLRVPLGWLEGAKKLLNKDVPLVQVFYSYFRILDYRPVAEITW